MKRSIKLVKHSIQVLYYVYCDVKFLNLDPETKLFNF